MKSVHILLSFLLYFGLNSAEGALIIKYTSFYEIKFCSEYWIDSKKSGIQSTHNFSIWKPSTVEDGFYPLGDIVSLDSNNKPDIQSVMVSNDFTEPPKEMNCTDLVFDDPSAGKICHLVPASDDYKCLGEIFQMEGGKVPPPEYRCVYKDVYYSIKNTNFFWEVQALQTRLTHGDKVRSFWTVPPARNDFAMIKVGTFISSMDEVQPTLNTIRKNDSIVLLHRNVEPVSQTLVVSDTQDFELIYTYTVIRRVNRSSPIVKSQLVALWRLSNTSCCSLGDVVQLSNHGNMRIAIRPGDFHHKVDRNVKPHGGIFNEFHEPPLQAILSIPTGFQEIWTDPVAAGLAIRVQAYIPICQEGYVALGVFFSRRNDLSALEDLAKRARCVRQNYVIPAKWSRIWADTHHPFSGATLWQVQPDRIQPSLAASVLNVPTFATPDLRRGEDLFHVSFLVNEVQPFPYMLDKSRITYVPKFKTVKRIEIQKVVMDPPDESTVKEEIAYWSTGLWYRNCGSNESLTFQGDEIQIKVESGEVWTVDIPRLITNPTAVNLVYDKGFQWDFVIPSGGHYSKTIRNEFRTKTFRATPVELEPNATAAVWGRAAKRTQQSSWEGTATFIFEDGQADTLMVVGNRKVIGYAQFSTEIAPEADTCPPTPEQLTNLTSLNQTDLTYYTNQTNQTSSLRASSPATNNRASINIHWLALLILLLFRMEC